MKSSDVQSIREALRYINRRAGVLKSDPYGIDLSLTQGSALVDIGRFNPIKPNDLARLLHLEKSSVSRLLATLEEKGMIATEDDPNDGRSKFLKLTDFGKKAVKVINNQSDKLVKDLIASLSTKDQREVVTAFKRLIQS